MQDITGLPDSPGASALAVAALAEAQGLAALLGWDDLLSTTRTRVYERDEL